MPYLSIVLPCYRVQAYLRECLDSILEQSFSDIEVIAIDDASPDHCGEILDEFAKRDSRMEVIHLEKNVGLGLARNIGLERAQGGYILFVDSDDFLADGALEAIAHRLRETTPDVLLFDHARHLWDGKTKRNIMTHLFREPPPPDVFTLSERPSVMNLMMTAWNKAFHRETLLKLGLRFSSGYYEDLPVTYPILMTAKRISFLDRVCYYYRQRPIGAITKTPGREHFAAFDQYERVFEFMDRAGPSVDEFRPAMFDRMMWHLLIILQHKRRVPVEDRKEFFARMANDYHRFKPERLEPPEGMDGWKYHLLERRAFRLFELLRAGKLMRISLRATRKRVRNHYAKRRRKVGQKVRGVQYAMYRRAPIKDNLAVFSCYWGRPPSCNPLAIYNKLKALAPHIESVWVVSYAYRKQVPDGIAYVIEGTADCYRALARAKYFVNNVDFPNNIVKRPGTIHLQTQHGVPLKTMGLDMQQFPTAARDMKFDLLLDRASRWDFNVSSNRHSSEVWDRAFPVSYVQLEHGYPRNDRYYTTGAEEIATIRQKLGIKPEQTAILYAPTHRDYRDEYEPQFDIARIARELPADQVLLVRAHYFYDNPPELEALQHQARVIDVSSYPNTEDLCLAADVLVSDYSSITFDYANLARPIVLYLDDYETYRRVRGVTFDIAAEAPGVTASTEDELIEVLSARRFESPEAQKRLALFREKFCEWDDGGAAERVIRKVFLGEEVVPPTPLEARAPAPAPRDLVERTKT